MARPLLAALAWLLVAAAPAPDPMLAPDAEATWVAFDPGSTGQIRFVAELDGRPVAAMLDTGVSRSVLARTSPAVDPARLTANGAALAVGGSVPISRMGIRRVAVGGLARTGGALLVADLGVAANGVELLVGQDLIGGVAIDIDYPGRRFRLIPSGRLPFDGATAPLAASVGRGLPTTTLTLEGRRLTPVLVDTGDGAAATLGPAARPALPETTTSGLVWGLGGPVETEMAIAPAVELGEATARDVEVRVEGADGFVQRLGLAGRIGAGLLARYRVLIDPGAGRMVLRAADAAPPPTLRSTSGLLLGAEADRLRVLHVMRGGPAQAAGWRAGETICAVDGRPVAAGYAASPLARWTVGAPGTSVSLTPCGGVPRRLVLARFY